MSIHDGSEEGCVRVVLEYEGDVRENVFHACAQRGLPILEMSRSNLTLEEIFLKLTADEDVIPAMDQAEYTVETALSEPETSLEEEGEKEEVDEE